MKSMLIFILMGMVQDPAIEKAEKALSKSPEDAAAHLTLAIYYAEHAKWDLALPHFEKVKNQEIRAAVEVEKKVDGNKFTSVEIGDAWSKALSKAGLARQACFDRMNVHYADAWVSLDEFGRGRLKERLTRLYTPLVPVKSSDLPKGWGGPVDLRSKAVVSSVRVRSGSGALRLTPTGAGTASVVRIEIPLPHGTSFEFSGWVASEGTDTTQDWISYTILDKDRKSIVAKNFIFPPDFFVWTRVGNEGAVPEGAFSVRIEIVLGSSKGVAWADDLSFMVDHKELILGGGFEGK